MIAKEVGERRQKAALEVTYSLWDDPLLKIDRKAMMNNSAPDDLVIARVGDFAYTWGDYRRDTQRRYSAPPTFEDRLELLKQRAAILPEKIVDAKVVALGLDREPATKMLLDATDMIYRGRAYVDWYARQKIAITQEKFRQFYLAERDRFREPGRYRLRELIVKLDPEDTSDTKKIETITSFLRDTLVKEAATERKFGQLAEDHGNWPVAKDERGAIHWVEESFRGPEFAKQLAALPLGSCQGPFKINDEIFLIWIRERSEIRYRPFDAVRKQVEDAYYTQHWDELLGTAEREVRSRHRLELLFTYQPEGTTDGAKGTTTTLQR